jgi:hypothetical protein
LFLAEEAYVFSSCCIKLFIQPNPPPALANYEPTGILGDVIASAHMLQELYCEYGDDLHSHYEALLSGERNESVESGAI